MELHVVIEGRDDLTGQLYRQLREAIRSGRLGPGDQLPPSRLLAQQLGVSRKVVSEAYARLGYEHWVTARVGVGSFVAARGELPTSSPTTPRLAGARVAAHWRDLDGAVRHPAPEARQRYEFLGGAPSAALFPKDEWRRCVMHALRQTASQRGLYAASEGLFALREAIARHVGFSRGVRCEAADVIVTTGAQQALDLVSRVLVEPGCTVAVEDPGYPPPRLLLTALGARVTGVPVDSEGLCVDRIPDGTRLIYVTPTHQFPLGMPMSRPRRLDLLQRARELGAIVIEDDYDSDFRHEGRPLDSLQSLDRDGLVAYVGTFSKSLSPDLRLGYAIPPPSIHSAIVNAKYLTDYHTPVLTQAALARFIADGHLMRHVRRCHTVYAARREKLVRRLDGDLAPWLERVPSVAGFHLTALFRKPMPVPLVVDLARRVEVALYPIDQFHYQQPVRSGLLFGYGLIDSLDIDPALDRVRDVMQQLD